MSSRPEPTQSNVTAPDKRSSTDNGRTRAPVGPLLANAPLVAQYAAVLLIVGVVAGLRVAAAPFMGLQAPLLPFGFAVFAAAYLCGYGPALAATAAASISATLLFADLSEPDYVLAWTGHVMLFTTLGVLVALLMNRLQLSYAIQHRLLLEARAREQQVRTITDAMPALIAYVDTAQRYQFVNKGYEDWFRLGRAQLIDRSVREVLGEKTYGIVEPHVRKALEGTTVSFDAEVEYHDKDTRHVSAQYVPDKALDGTVRGYFAFVQDVTQRTKDRRALEEARLRLGLAMRVGRSGAFEWQIEHDVNSWTDELLELYGFKPGEFAGTYDAWQACVHPDDRAQMTGLAERAIRDGEFEVAHRIVRRDSGETRWLQSRGKVFYDADGKPIRIVGINVDVTAQKRAEEALRDADRRKDAFLAMLAHELRNPLAPIRNVAHMLTDQRADIDTLRRCGRLVQRQVANLGRLVDDLLDIARIRSGRIEINREPVDLHTIVERSIETLQTKLDEKQQAVAVEKVGSAARTVGDPIRLEQVFTNLLANAAKFSPKSARIDVRVETHEGNIVVSVRDHGVGIDAQLLPRVFDLFVQGDQTLDRPQAGLGIGLTLVKWIVELHDGSVAVRSTGLGRGAEFTVTLPIVEVTETSQQEPPHIAEPRVRRRVLIVEDNSDTAVSFEMLLRLAGHEVVTAEHPRSALAALDTFAPEWIFADVGLPDLDGYSLAELIREHPRGKDAWLYAVTGYGRSEDREHALRAGFDGHLTKPVDPNTLLEMLVNPPTRNGDKRHRSTAEQ